MDHLQLGFETGKLFDLVEDVVIRLDFIFHSILEVLPTFHNVDGAIILCQRRQKSEALHVSSSIEQKEKEEDETV